MRLLFYLARYPFNRELRLLSTLPSTDPIEHSSPAYKLQEESETSPIVRALRTPFASQSHRVDHKTQNIPDPHAYDATDYLTFLSHYIASFQMSSLSNTVKNFLEIIEQTWLNFFQYLQKRNFYYLLRGIARKNYFQNYVGNFNVEFQRETFNAIAHISALSDTSIKLSENLRNTPMFAENEYEKLSNILTHHGLAKYRRSTNHGFEKDRYKQFLLLIEEMKSQSMKPTINICLNTVESLFHINANRGDSIVPVMRAILEEHPQLARHPRMIILSSRISNRLDVLETTKKLHMQGCPVNGENISQLMQGIVYGDFMSVDRYNNYVPSRDDMEQVYNITTNELLPYLTQSNIDLFFKAAYGADTTILALKFYLIIRNFGYFPGNEGFKHLLLLFARKRDKSAMVLTFWEDLSEVYYGLPPPWGYQSLVTALCISKGSEGALIFGEFLQQALKREKSEGATTHSASHWAWSPEMCVAKFRGYSWAKCYNEIYTLLKEMRELRVQLTPGLVEASFLPHYNRGMFNNYFSKLLQVLFESPTPLSASSIHKGITKCLFRNQLGSQALGKLSSEIDILGVNIDPIDDNDSEKKQKMINTAIANSVTKFILDENYRRRVSKNKLDIMQIHSAEFRKFFETN